MITSRVSFAVAIGAVAGLLAPFLTPALAQEGHSPFNTGQGWALVDQRSLEFDGELIALSPDGQWIAGFGPDHEFCVWEVASGDPVCDEEEQPIAPDTVAWAPDSTAVAYALDAGLRFYDSDIFVFELDAGHSVNLTDDGYDKHITFGEQRDDLDALPIDVFPTWTADSQSLVFARTDWIAEPATTDLMSIARTGGEPTFLATVSDDTPLAIYTPMFPLADGSLLYVVGIPDADDRDSGVWRLGSGGETIQVMPAAANDPYPQAALVDVREANGAILATGLSRAALNSIQIENDVTFELDIDTGAATPVTVKAEYVGYVYGYSYAPDGASSIGMERSDVIRRIVITSESGAELDLGDFEGGRYLHIRGLAWATNNTILIPNFGQGGTLVTVRWVG